MDKTLVIQDEDLQKTINILQAKFDDPTQSIVSLCEDEGLSRQQYYRKLNEGNEIINILRELITKSKRIQLATIAIGKHEILENIITQAIGSDDLDTMVKVAKYLDDHAENLQDDLGAKPGLEDEAREFLKKGPKIQKQESKFASIRVSEDEDGEPVIDLYKQIDVIEGTSEDIS